MALEGQARVLGGSLGNMTDGEPHLHIPEGISYNCQGCGRCCSGFAVGLTHKDYDKVKDTDWGKLNPLLSGIELFTHKEKEFKEGTSAFPIYTKAHANGACPFLVDNLCIIHGTLGESEKPTVCQLFPYTFVGTPRGVYAGVSHSSMASVRNIGRPLTEQRTMLEETLQLNKKLQNDLSAEAGANAKKIVSGINLAPGVPINWDEYFLIEEQLMQIARNEAFDDSCQMWLACCEVLAEAVRLKTAGQDLTAIKEFKPNVSSWLDKVPTAFESLLLMLISFRDLTWPMIKRRRMENNQKPASRADVFGYALKVLTQKQMEFPNCGSANIENTMRQPFKPLSAEIDHFMRQYLYLRLFSKTYFASGMAGLSVVAGFNHLVAIVITSLVYGKACAIKRGEDQIAIADLYESFLLLDKQLLQVSAATPQMALLYDQAFASPFLFSRLIAQVRRSFSN